MSETLDYKAGFLEACRQLFVAQRRISVARSELDDAETAAATGTPHHRGFDADCAACRCLLHVRRAVAALNDDKEAEP